MTNPWILPPAGPLTNQGQPWQSGQTVTIPLSVSDPGLTVQVMGGVVPPGLVLAGGAIQGVLGDVGDQTSWPVVLRATRTGDGRVWDRGVEIRTARPAGQQSWAGGGDVVDLGDVARDAGVLITLGVQDPSGEALEWEVWGADQPGCQRGLPQGLAVDPLGRLTGRASMVNPPGRWAFHVVARRPEDLLTTPRGEGQPRMGWRTWTLNLLAGVDPQPGLGDRVSWVTDPGPLGGVPEGQRCWLGVRAQAQVPQGDDGLPAQQVWYDVQAGQLPPGLQLDGLTGEIRGRPQRVLVDQAWDFTARARLAQWSESLGAYQASQLSSTRAFQVTVRNVWADGDPLSIHLPPPPGLRADMAAWLAGDRLERAAHQLGRLGHEVLLRPTDPQWRAQPLPVLLQGGLRWDWTGDLAGRLLAYHHPTELTLGGLTWSAARDELGRHVWDALWIPVLDPLEGAGGFQGGVEVPLSRPTGQAIPAWNLGSQDGHVWPGSLRNRRLDLSQATARLAWPERGLTPQGRGLGVLGGENLPLWMTTQQRAGAPGPGWRAAMELVRVRPGLAGPLVDWLVSQGFNDAFQGTGWPVQAYLARGVTGQHPEVWLTLAGVADGTTTPTPTPTPVTGGPTQ